MAFPTSSAWPGASDPPEVRVDLADLVYARDFMWNDARIISLQDMFGNGVSEAIGEAVGASYGVAGLASPVASGGVAMKLAAKNPFVAGDILQVLDNGLVGTVKARLNYAGLMWALAGFDAGQGLIIPTGALPAPGSAGRVQWDTAAQNLKYDNGAAWLDVGATAGSYVDMASAYQYTQPGVPVEEVMGGGMFDGNRVGSLQAYFRAVLVTNYAGVTGPTLIRLYDMGPKAGPPAGPTLIATLSTSVNGGPQVIEQALSVAGAPGANTIQNTARMYEITIAQSPTTVGDTAYVHSSGLVIV